MEKSFDDLLKKSVKSSETGRFIGKITDVFLKRNGGEFYGFVTTDDSRIYKNRFFKREQIVGEENNFLIVSGYGEKFLKTPPIIDLDLRSFKSFFKNRLTTDSGGCLGKIKNCNFDCETGKMIEISLKNGTNISLNGSADIVSDTIYVKEDDFSISKRDTFYKKLFKKGEGKK